MVLTKETALNNTVLPGTQQTTVTTRTTEVPVVHQPVVEQNLSNVVHKDAIVTNVMEKPVLQNVVEKKNVEVHHKNVVQEIHEQKIIEIEKQNLVQNVHQPTLVQQERVATKFEEIGNSNMSEQERLRLQQLQAVHAPVVTQTGGVKQFQEGEQVAQVVRQEFIEHHVQPVITEVREQNIVQEVVHPVVRKVHEDVIIREVTSTSAPLTTGVHTDSHQSGHHHTGLQQGTTATTGLQSSGLQQGLVQTTTAGTGLTGTTTTTTGSNPVLSEQRNLGLHEQKLMNNNAPLTTTERQNIAVHEQVVDNVVKGQSGLTGAHTTTGTTTGAHTTGTHTTGAHTTGTHTTGSHTTTSGTHLGNEEKPGFMERVKEKLHIGHHNTTNTTNTTK